MAVDKIINDLERTNGLANVKLVGPELKRIIQNLEDKDNHGVLECLNRKFTLALTHDSTFREPTGKIVVKNKSKIILPAVPFPEVKGKEVVSSSPSTKVHEVIVGHLGMELRKDDATLLIGFNL